MLLKSLDYLERKDDAEQHLMQTYHTAWSSWCCAQCKSEEMFPQLVCKDNGHKLTKKDTVRYKFQCKQCKQCQWSLSKKHPKLGCQCGMSRDGYVMVPIKKARKYENADLAERQNMKARGTEHSFSLKS
jgi:hypothetical protein